jgi:hypothetical protein
MTTARIGSELRLDEGERIVGRTLRPQGRLQRCALRLGKLVQLFDKSLELRRFHRALQ